MAALKISSSLWCSTVSMAPLYKENIVEEARQWSAKTQPWMSSISIKDIPNKWPIRSMKKLYKTMATLNSSPTISKTPQVVTNTTTQEMVK